MQKHSQYKTIKTLCLLIALSLSALFCAISLIGKTGFALVYGACATLVSVALAVSAHNVYAKGCLGGVATMRVIQKVKQIASAIYALVLALAVVFAVILLLLADMGAFTLLVAFVLLLLCGYRVLLFYYYKRTHAALNVNEKKPLIALGKLSLAAGTASAAGAIMFIIIYALFSSSVSDVLANIEISNDILKNFLGDTVSAENAADVKATIFANLFPNAILCVHSMLARASVYYSVYALTRNRAEQ